jgi:hypothetical protein
MPVDDLRMLMPVSVRSPDDPLSGNRFAPVRFPVPMTIADPLERIGRLGEISRRWRAEPALGVTDAVAAVLDRLPAAAAARLFGMLLKNVDFVTTNVGGFPFAVYMGGARLTRYYAFPPTMGAAVNVALLSHESTACIGATVDSRAIPDLEEFLRCLDAGFDEVAAATPTTSTPRRSA